MAKLKIIPPNALMHKLKPYSIIVNDSKIGTVTNDSTQHFYIKEGV